MDLTVSNRRLYLDSPFLAVGAAVSAFGMTFAGYHVQYHIEYFDVRVAFVREL